MKNIILIIFLCLIANLASAGPGTWPKGGKIFVSKPSLFFKGGNVSIITNDSDDPTSVAKAGDEGSMYIRNGTGVIYQKQDTGSSTNWLPLLIGPAGSGTDECIVRWDGTGSPALQDTTVCITDSGAIIGALSISLSGLTADRALISDGGKTIIVSTVTSTELAFLSGATSTIQVQLDAKLEKALTDTQIFVGNGSNIATGVAMSSEATIANTGAITLDNDAVIAKELARIGSPTFASIQELQNIFHSVGRADGGLLTSGGVGTIDVAAGSGYLRASDSETVDLLVFDWTGGSVALTDNQLNYIYVEYNAGSPQVIATTSKRTDLNTNVWLGTVTREGTTLHISNATEIKVANHAALMSLRLLETQSFARVSGGTVGETGTRNITVSAGIWWEGLTTFTTAAIDTSAADTFDLFYRDGIGGFTQVAAQTQYNNTQWDDGDGGLATLTNNRYGVSWFYIEQDGDVSVVLGRGDYTLSQAQDADEPGDTPIRLTNHGRLIGKLIVQKNAGTATSIESAFERAFEKNPVTDHASLIGLGVDDHTQYALLAGRAGGQTLIGGTAANDDITFQTTSDGAKGDYLFSELSDGPLRITSTALVTGAIDLTSEVTGVLPVANFSPIIGTANQVIVANGSGAITLSLPQDIATTSNMQLGQLDLLTQGELRFQDAAGGEYVSLRAPPTVSGSFTMTLFPDAGIAGQVIQTDGVSSLGFVTLTSDNSPGLLSNVGLSIDVSGAVTNAVVISLKQSDSSTDPTGGSPVKIGFRDTTLTTGGFNVRAITASLSWTIDSGATGGTTSGDAHQVYLYLIDDADGAGAIEGAWSLKKFDETKLQSTTLSDSSADDAYTLYSDTARTTKPIKLIGSFLSTQATAGTWLTAATETFVGESALAEDEFISACYKESGGQVFSTNSATDMNFEDLVYDTVGLRTGTTPFVATFLVAGKYLIIAQIKWQTGAWNTNEPTYMRLKRNGSAAEYLAYHNYNAAGTPRHVSLGNSMIIDVNAADTLSVTGYHNSGTDKIPETSGDFNFLCITRIGK